MENLKKKTIISHISKGSVLELLLFLIFVTNKDLTEDIKLFWTQICQKDTNNIQKVWNNKEKLVYEHTFNQEEHYKITYFLDGFQIVTFPEILEEHYSAVEHFEVLKRNINEK